MTVEAHAGILLVFRLITVGLLGYLVVEYVKLARKTTAENPLTRRALMSIILSSLAGNVLPIWIDYAALTGKDYTGELLIPYAYSNAVSLMLTAIGWIIIYRESKKDSERLNRKNEALTDDNASLSEELKEERDK